MSVLDAAIALASLGEMKSFLAQDATDEFLGDTGQDTELEHILNAVGRYFNSYTKRNLVSVSRTQYYDGFGDDTLFVDSYPISLSPATLTLYIDADRVYGAGTIVPTGSIIIYAEEGKIAVEDTVFSRVKQSTKIVYTGGYVISGTGENRPDDLRMAALIMGGYLWKMRKDRLFGMASVQVAGQSSQPAEGGMPVIVKDILDEYRRFSRAAVL